MSGKGCGRTGPIPLSLNQSFTLYLLGQESVLFSEQSRQLYGLDRTATLIALMLDEGATPEALSRKLALTESASQAAYELAALLEGREEITTGYETDVPCPGELPIYGQGAPAYRLLNTDFIVEGPEAFLREWVFPWLGHLRIKTGADLKLVIAIEPDGRAFRLTMNGALQGGPLPPEHLLPLLQDRLRKYAYQRRAYLIAVHGAVVTDGVQTMVLAGLSGSGKSTLAAALLSRGYKLVSDEPAVIDPMSGGAWPIPLGLGLKAGSWSAVLRDYPALNELPVHIRWDGQPIRFLGSDEIDFYMAIAACPVTHLIFPRYNADSAGTIEPLTPVQGLRAITEAGYQVPGLDEKRVAQILDWINGLSCYTLFYSSTDEALGLLKEVLQGTCIHTSFAGCGEVVR